MSLIPPWNQIKILFVTTQTFVPMEQRTIKIKQQICILPKPGVNHVQQWCQVVWMLAHHRDGLSSLSFRLTLNGHKITYIFHCPSHYDLEESYKLIHLTNPTMHQSHIPQCASPISHNAPFCNRNVHIYVTKWCISWDWSIANTYFCFFKTHDVMQWKWSPYYWTFVKGIHYPNQQCRALMFSLMLDKLLNKQSSCQWSETP